MKARFVGTILAKELGETLRDWRTLVLMVFVPLVLYPAMVLVLAQVAGAEKAERESETSRVALAGAPAPTALLARFAATERVTTFVLDPGTTPLDAVLAEDADLAVVLEEGFAEQVSAGGTGRARLLRDGTRERSGVALDRVQAAFDAYRDEALAARLASVELQPAFVRPVVAADENVAPPERMGGHVLGQVLPMLIVLTVLLGAFHPAVDLTAGEKERGTIQTLLTAPVTALDIVAGKYLAVCAMAFLSGIVNVGAMALVASHALALGDGALAVELTLGAGELLLLLVTVVATGLFFSALMMTVAVLARSFKEAQNYLMPVYLACLVPAMVTQIPGVELGAGTALVPALNVTLLLKGILTGTADPDSIFTVLGATFAYTAAVLALAGRLFQRESVLLGTTPPLVALLERGGAVRRLRAEPSEALALFAFLFVLLYYVGALLQRWNLVGGLVATLVGLVAAPTIAFALLRRLPLRDALALRRPSLRSLAAAALLGVSAWVLVLALVVPLQAQVLPVPKEMAEEFAGMFEGFGDSPGALALLFAVVALAPAVCEELAFRGLLLGAFRDRMPAWSAVALSALLFGLFHLSLYRLGGTFVLGVLAGTLAWRGRSIAPAMLFHGLNNAALLVVATVPAAQVLLDEGGFPRPPVIAGAALLAVAGGWLLARPVR